MNFTNLVQVISTAFQKSFNFTITSFNKFKKLRKVTLVVILLRVGTAIFTTGYIIHLRSEAENLREVIAKLYIKARNLSDEKYYLELQVGDLQNEIDELKNKIDRLESRSNYYYYWAPWLVR